MKLNLSGIRDTAGGISEFDFEERTVDFDFDREDIKNLGPVRVKGQIENLGGGLFQVTGQIEATADTLCSRCLTATQISLKIDFLSKFKDMVSESKEDEEDEEDEDILELHGDDVDLYPLILEEIILNWPSQIFCKDDCKGLCPNCGVNLNTTTCKCEINNIDPRLAVLKQLLKSD